MVTFQPRNERSVGKASAVALVWLTSACGYISDAELAGRMDLDGDGLPWTEDCDDRDPTVGKRRYYVDLDQDGFGDPNVAQREGCAVREGLSEVAGDCDDSRPLVHPGQTEICNQIDDDCNGLADDGVVDLRVFYQDADGDGLGDEDNEVQTCFRPAGYVTNSDDCDDQNATTFGVKTWYSDSDGDGWGAERSGVLSCEAPAGTVGRAGDCNDYESDIHPDAQEVCDLDEQDEDCDRAVNDSDPTVDLSTGITVWADLDGDGLGDADQPGLRCAAAPELGWVSNRDDCDDTDPTILDTDCPYLQVSAGGRASCAVRGDRRLVCWGDSEIASNVPAGIFMHVSVGDRHACALKIDGTLSCWGETGASTFLSTDPLYGLDVDGSFTCSLTDKEDLQCWYSGIEFRLGMAGKSFVDFEAGTTHSCGILGDNTVQCLGLCDRGECSDPGDEWLDIAAGTEATCGLDMTGAAFCWGNVEGMPPSGVFDTIEAYGDHVCVSSYDGIPTCWTRLGEGQPVRFGDVSLSDWDVGDGHGCGITEDTSQLMCWGTDDVGQASPPE